MKFIDDNNTNPQAELFYRKVSECGKIEIGVAPVLYGFRVRAGYTNDFMYHIDYCAGNNLDQVQRIYSIVLSILSARTHDFFEGFPVEHVKPMHNNPQCFIKLIHLLGTNEVINVKTPNIHNLKQNLFHELFSTK